MVVHSKSVSNWVVDSMGKREVDSVVNRVLESMFRYKTREDRRILSQRGGHYVKAYRKLLAGDYIMKGIFKYN